MISKGDWTRPVNKKKFDEGFEVIFGKRPPNLAPRCPQCGGVVFGGECDSCGFLDGDPGALDDKPFFDRLDEIDEILDEANALDFSEHIDYLLDEGEPNDESNSKRCEENRSDPSGVADEGSK